MTDHANMLRQAAAEMRHYGHDGWPNVCDWGADEIERLRGLLREAAANTRCAYCDANVFMATSDRIDAFLRSTDSAEAGRYAAHIEMERDAHDAEKG